MEVDDEEVRKGVHVGDQNATSPLVDISVGGTPFTIPRSFLFGRKWILSQILDGSAPWGTYHDGRYFIAADPAAFRWALHFIRHESLPREILDSETEIDPLRKLAEFLRFEDLIRYIDSQAQTFEETIRALQLENQQLRGKIEEQKMRIQLYESSVAHIDLMGRFHRQLSDYCRSTV